MQTKTIDKLEELKDYPWEYKDKKFILNSVNGGAILIHKDFIGIDGKLRNFPLMTINHKNLTELEFYGLKVVLNEKPKLTRKELDLVESIELEFWLSRDMSGELYLSSHKPDIPKGFHHWRSKGWNLKINGDVFPFITWESGKAWSKAELIELEVVD